MSTVMSMGNLFDPKLVTDLFNRVKGKSSVAALEAFASERISGK